MGTSLSIARGRLAVAGVPDAVRPDIRNGIVKFWCDNFKATGEVALAEGPPDADIARTPRIPRAASSPVGMGWRAGWVQLCCQEEVWAIYRGANPSDGTIRARWPSYEALDTFSSDSSDVFVTFRAPFYKELSAASPLASIEFVDIPIHEFETTLMNNVTRKINTIAVSVARFSFILALAVKDPEDHLHVVKWLPWWARWESTYQLGGAANVLTDTPVRSRTQGGTGNPQFGVPANLLNAIRFGSRSSANTQAQNVETKHYPRWQDLAHVRALPPLPRRPAAAPSRPGFRR
jgi:hypothetical protein